MKLKAICKIIITLKKLILINSKICFIALKVKKKLDYERRLGK